MADRRAIRDALRQHAAGMRASSAGFGGRAIPQQVYDPDIVLVRNDSGSDQGQFAVLGINGPVASVSDADSAEQFIENPLVAGVSPALANHLGRFVVLIEPVASGRDRPRRYRRHCALQGEGRETQRRTR